ncbi:MAG: hypothetical protein K0B10_02195 [Vicingaceae bacterium]|nr:hypothetical protein [Vicingaceae bacterium]
MNKLPKIILNETREEVEIPESGSLGLLALGAVGIKAWREARDKIATVSNEKKTTPKKNKKEVR